MRIHIINDRDPAAALRLSPQELVDCAAASGLDAKELVISEGDGSHYPDDADVVFACVKPNVSALKEKLPSLRWVQVISAGVEAIIPTLPGGVALTNASGVHGEKGGEFVLAAALMLNYRIPGFVSDKAEGKWQPRFETPARGKRVTLLGVGGIGGEAARRLRSNGYYVTGVTRSGRADVELDHCIATDMLDGVLSETDVLVSTLPATPATRGLIDRRRLGLLPQRAGIVVVGRAAVLDYAAMAEMLEAGRLSGAVLDVFDMEPLPAGDRLWSCRNLIMTPHCSVDDHVTYMAGCLSIFTDNLKRLERGEPLRNEVDPKLGY
jgi:phosphoglycerate dehydrogenase-like enzyme